MILTVIGETVDPSANIVTKNQETVQSDLLTDSGQNVEDSSGHSVRDPTDGTV